MTQGHPSDRAITLRITGSAGPSEAPKWTDQALRARVALASIARRTGDVPGAVYQVTSPRNSANASLAQFSRLLVLRNLLTTYRQGNTYTSDNDSDPFGAIRGTIPLKLFESYRDRIEIQEIHKSTDGKTLALELTLFDADGAKKSRIFAVQELGSNDIILCGDDKRALSLHTDRYSLISRILLQLDGITGSEVDTLNRGVIFGQSPADIESIGAMNIPSISDEFAKQKAFGELVAILNKNLDYYTVLLSSGNHTGKKEQVLTTLRYIGALYLLVLHAFGGLQWNGSIHLDIATLGRYFRELDPIQTKRFDRGIGIFTQGVDTIFSDSSEQEKIALQFGAFFDNIMREFLSMRGDDTAGDFLSFTNGGLYDLFKELAILHPVVSSYKLRAVRDTERQEVA